MIIWITGISGAGKTHIAKKVHKIVKKKFINTLYLDGDLFREMNGNDIGYSLADRDKNAIRMTKFCKYLDDQNINVICGANLTSQKYRNWCKKNINNYYEVFIDVPFEKLVERDQKNLYKRAIAGKIKNVVGVDIPFIKPKNPDLTVDNSGSKKWVKNIVDEIIAKSKLIKKI